MKNKLPKNKSDNKGVVPAVICDTCANCKISELTMSITCLVKHKFKEDGKTQSEFIKIIGGVDEQYFKAGPDIIVIWPMTTLPPKP